MRMCDLTQNANESRNTPYTLCLIGIGLHFKLPELTRLSPNIRLREPYSYTVVMEDVPFVKFKRTRGAPLKYGPDKETSRREIARQRDATKVYLLTSHDEWRSAKQTYERRLRKPITNSEFALHLLSIHRKSKCPTCTNLDQR